MKNTSKLLHIEAPSIFTLSSDDQIILSGSLRLPRFSTRKVLDFKFNYQESGSRNRYFVGYNTRVGKLPIMGLDDRTIV